MYFLCSVQGKDFTLPNRGINRQNRKRNERRGQVMKNAHVCPLIRVTQNNAPNFGYLDKNVEWSHELKYFFSMCGENQSRI